MNQGTDKSAAVDPGQAPAALRRPEELRLSARASAGPAIASVSRLRAIGESLIVLPPTSSPGDLELGEDILAEAENALALGEAAEARLAAASLLPPHEGNRLTSGVLEEDHAEACCVLARSHLMEGDTKAARALLEPHLDDARLALATAALYLSEGDLDRSRERLDVALDRRPKGLREHYLQALFHASSGDMHAAAAGLSRVAASSPTHAVARHQLGQLILADGDNARAGTLFEMSLELAPSFLPPALALAELLIDSRHYNDAMGTLAFAIEHSPQALAPRLLQLRVLLELGENATALNLARGLKQAAADHPEVVALWAEALLGCGKSGEAIEELERLIPRVPVEQRVRLLRTRGRIALDQEPADLEAAVKSFELAIEVAARPGELRLELAQIHLAAGSPRNAQVALEALARDPRTELSPLLSGALMARDHALFPAARQLAEAALGRVSGSGASQLRAFLQSLPVV
ncbi:MAG: tetratricopeptide repeat protein [Myxococcota bacterium]